MTAVKALLSGIYPRSEALIQATRDHDRGRIDDAKLDQQFAEDQTALIQAQLDHGFDLLSDGLLNWQDDFRPLVSACRGIALGPLVRYFNTNTFYRQPVFVGKPELDLEALAPYYARASAATARVAALPGLAALSEMSAGQRRLEDVRALLEQAGAWLAARGDAVQLQEPWLSYHGYNVPQGKLNAYADALRELVQAIRRHRPRAQVGIHLPFGDAAPLLEALDAVPFDFIGVDFYETDLEALKPLDWSKRALLAGCVNGRNSLLESDEVVQEFIERLVETLDPGVVYLSNTVDLKFVPEPIAKAKLILLGRAKRRYGAPASA